MIIIASNSPRETAALLSLAADRHWPAYSCGSVRQFKKTLRKMHPSIVVTRDRLPDGYSDDLFSLLGQAGFLPGTRVIVLAAADCTQKQEARQLSLGADCVLKDPVRPEVLQEYLAKFLRKKPDARLPPGNSDRFPLGGAVVEADRNQLSHGGRAVHVTPREIELARILAESPGKVVPYAFLYGELFERAFTGDTANLRVLLGKLTASFRKLGLNLREMIRVTPKTGYCYLPPPDRTSQSQSA